LPRFTHRFIACLTFPLLMGAQGQPVTKTAVAILWHQHQPRYPQRPGTKVFEQPWVRLHTTKDYADMVQSVTRFKDLKVSFNLTPVLIEQIEAYNAGATDRHAELASRDPATWTPDEKAEAANRFFQVSQPMLKRFPRLAALKARPWRSLNAQDWRDAVMLFHLAWTDTDWLNWTDGEGKKDAVGQRWLKQTEGFSHHDMLELLRRHRGLLRGVIPLHRQAQLDGAIEVSTTPYYHPILPLLHSTELASEAMERDSLPEQPFAFPEDARYHVEAAQASYRKHFGRPATGMWPGEGSVAQAVMPLFKAAGIQWVATDEEVLARSLGRDLTGADREHLYRPWQEPNGVALLFRDRKLSDDIGFRYGNMAGEVAAQDLLNQLEAIAKPQAAHPRLVTIILDGENCWENYPDDGKAFLNALYQGLSNSKLLDTTTPSRYLQRNRPEPLKHLWAGSWINANFATWIGEPDENRAWDALRDARRAVQQFGVAHGLKHPAYQKALKTLYIAEGSDWFWWYGQDQDSGRDETFDLAYRQLLQSAYQAIAQTPPTSLKQSLTHQSPGPRKPKGTLHPTLDGNLQRQEWADAGACFAPNGTMNQSLPIQSLFYGQDQTYLYLGIQYAGSSTPCQVQVGQLTLDCDAKIQAPAGVIIKTGAYATELAVPLSLLQSPNQTARPLQVRCQTQTLPNSPLMLNDILPTQK
jgi:alpha-amylase/alpha-mannosidase (GH57 family)